MKRCGNALLLICGCICQFTSSELRAQPYPAKPVRVVIPATPGSNTDIFFRIIAPKMGAMLGQQFVADYRAGAGGGLPVPPRGLPVRDRSRGGDGRADVPREGARDRGRFAEMQRTGRGGLPRDAEEQGDERQHARRRHAKNTHREGALQPISSRSRSEVAAHD